MLRWPYSVAICTVADSNARDSKHSDMEKRHAINGTKTSIAVSSAASFSLARVVQRRRAIGQWALNMPPPISADPPPILAPVFSGKLLPRDNLDPMPQPVVDITINLFAMGRHERNNSPVRKAALRDSVNPPPPAQSRAPKGAALFFHKVKTHSPGRPKIVQPVSRQIWRRR